MGSMGGGSFGWSGLDFNVTTWADVWKHFVANKFEPNEEDYEFVGIKSARLIWGTDHGIDNSTDDAGNSGLTVDTFDTITRADSAQIKLENTGGNTETIRGAVIRGKPVIRLSGESGYIHDDFVDYEDIYKNGEKKFELGNNYIVTKDQVEKLADFHWKNFKNKPHVYALTLKGTRYWFSPGQWYTLTFNYREENIDSVCECYSCQTERGIHDVGTTVVIFREVYESWGKDSNAIARFIAGGNPKNIPDYGRVVVASSTHLGSADYYCDGTSDEDEINAAISELAGVGGGAIELTEGTYYTDGKITLADNIALIGRGWTTIIEKNCNDHGIDLEGSAGSEHKNIILKDFKITRNASDTNSSKYLIYLVYCDNVLIDNVYAYNGYDDGIVLQEGDNNKIINSHAEDNAGTGITIKGNVNNAISAHSVNNTAISNDEFGICIHMTMEGIITNNTCRDNEYDGIFYNLGSNAVIGNNICINNAQSTGDTYAGISCSAGIGTGKNIIINSNYCEGNDLGIELSNTMYDTQVHSNSCYNNGDDSDISNGNSHNFADSGNDTYATGNSWQGPGST